MSRTTIIAISFLFFAHSPLAQAQNNEIYNYLVKFVQLYSSGDLKKAEECLLKILDSKEPITEEYLIITYNNLGSVKSLLGKYNEALKYYHLAENLVINKKQTSGYLADIYVNIGEIYNIKRSFPEAIKYFEISIRIYTAIGKPDKRIFQNLSAGYQNLGLTYYMIEDYNHALEYLQKSSNLNLKLNLPENAFTYLNIAKVYAKIGDQSESEIFFLKSIDEFEKKFGPNYYRITSVFFDYGLFLSSVGREQESFKYYQDALTICLKTYSKKHPFVSLAYKHIGDHYMKVVKYDSAIINYQRALTAGVLNFNNLNIDSNPSLDSVLIDVDLLRCLQKKSETLMLHALQQDKLDLRILFMKQSLETAEVILQLISNIRNSFVSGESQTYLAENEKETYFFATQIAQYLYSFTKDPVYVQFMYKIVLLSNAAVLRKRIAENQLYYSKNTPGALLQKLDSFNTDIAAYKRLILEESHKIMPDKIKLDFWKDTLFYMSIQKEKVFDEINRFIPQYRQILQKSKPLSLKEIQSGLKKNETLIEYFLSNQYKAGKRTLFIFVITKKQLNFKETYIDSLFIGDVGRIKQFLGISELQQISRKDLELFTTAQNNMYKKLIEPVTNYFSGKKLIIIPDEEIEYLSFDTFLKSKPDPIHFDFEELKYLIYDYTLSYGFSSSLIFNQDKAKFKIKDVYAFSPGYNKDVRNSYSSPVHLQGSGMEISSIDKWFHCEKYTNELATESNFKSVMKNPVIFHLAMHSYQDLENSQNSYLLFETKNDALEDGKLFTYEIELNRLNSPLIVLNGCNTGTGTLYHGEGVMSLGRGFILAGAESVVKTLWDVNDDAGSKIITDFYYFLSKGKQKDEALRLAKLKYLKSTSSTYTNPYYWGGYEVIGDKAGIVRNNTKTLFLISGTILFLCSGLIIYYFKLRKIFRARSL